MVTIRAIGKWDTGLEAAEVDLSDGTKFTLDMDGIQAITEAIYAGGSPIAFDRPKSVYPVDKWMVMPANSSLVLGFETKEQQTANFEIQTDASESRVEDAAATIQAAIRQLFSRAQ